MNKYNQYNYNKTEGIYLSKIQQILATAKTYAMLARVSRSTCYLKAARHCLIQYHSLQLSDKTGIIEYQ